MSYWSQWNRSSSILIQISCQRNAFQTSNDGGQQLLLNIHVLLPIMLQSTCLFNMLIFLLINCSSILFISTTDSNSFVSILRMRNCNSSSTITCSYWNKKNIRKRVLTGRLLISEWTSLPVLNLLKRYLGGDD